MSLKNAAFLALIGMMLLSVLLLAGFIRDVSVAVGGALPAVRVFTSLIYLLASFGVTLF
jgi:hypothetical protein